MRRIGSLGTPLTAIVVVVVLLFAHLSCSSDDSKATPSSPGRVAPGEHTTGATSEGPGPFLWTGDPKRNGSLEAVHIRARQVASLKEPTVLAQRPGNGRFYAAERAGTIRMLATDGDRLRTVGSTVLDISNDVTTESERGLLGLAFSADGSILYVSHTNATGDTRLESYRLRGDGTALASSKRVLIAQKQPFANHNGGNVVLGPDGDLYFGLGDGGSTDDPENRAQDPKELLGKILRIDPSRREAGRSYAIPAGNPYRAGGGRPEIYLSGVRNPWRFSFDRATGDLWIGDVGQNAVEEVDWLAKATGAGRNLGWSGYEGSVSYRDGPGRRPKSSVPPIFEYRHEGGACSITGGFIYRGRQLPELRGAYVFADYCVGQLRAVRLGPDHKVADERLLGVQINQPISFAQDDDGELYVLAQEGGVYRLQPR